MIVGIQGEILKINAMGLLDRLLTDKTTKTHILWATDAYAEYGDEYLRDKEINAELITGNRSGIIKNRARKALEQQSERTRQRGEVFTPLWVCAKMIDALDAQWFGKENAFFDKGHPTERVVFTKTQKWQHYVDDRRMELTCGEAPYLVSRYDVSTGESIPIRNRIGILDRKLRVVNEYAEDEAEWMKWTVRAYQAAYGYEFQGDNLLIARVNLLMTFEEYLQDRWKRIPTAKEYQTIANIIAWNIWQMDGLNGSLPYCRAEEEFRQIELFELLESEKYHEAVSIQQHCRIYDWRRENSLEYINVNTGGRNMKFSAIIGNPPYQEDVLNEKDRANPIYNKFMDACYEIGDVVLLIHPARFLFNAGQTPKSWNRKMMSDSHFKVLDYEADAAKIFPNTDIKGGVAFTIYDKNKNYGAIDVFTPFKELNSILRKVTQNNGTLKFLDSVVSPRGNYRTTELFFEDFKFAADRLGNGTGNMIASNFFEKLPEVNDDGEKNKSDSIEFLARVNNRRTICYLRKKYVKYNEFLDCYNIACPKSNGSGRFGETLTSTEVLKPNSGATDTFISIGKFQSIEETDNFQRYFSTKMFRSLLGARKVTQDNPRSVWSMIPLQDFTSSSDIDWSKSIAEIDRQLYAKYGLDEKEIEFIETHVKEMK